MSRLKNKHTHKTDVLAPISSARLLATRRARILPYIHATVAYVHMRYDTTHGACMCTVRNFYLGPGPLPGPRALFNPTAGALRPGVSGACDACTAGGAENSDGVLMSGPLAAKRMRGCEVEVPRGVATVVRTVSRDAEDAVFVENDIEG